MSTDSKQSFVLRDAYIELYKLIKLESLANSGGEAKTMIAGEEVKVNGLVETRKRRKLIPGDAVEVGGATIKIQGPNAQSS